MRCPHCAAESRYRERTGRICPRCRRQFTADPAVDDVRGGDRRLRRIVARLGADGVKYSETQLWYAAVNRTGSLEPETLWGEAGANFWMVVLPFLAVPLFFEGDRSLDAVVPLLITAVLVGVRIRRVARQPPVTTQMRASIHTFRLLLARWEQVYGGPPPGLVPDSLGAEAAGPPAAGAADPVLVVVAADQGVRACLVANGLPDRLRVRIVGSEVYVPAGVPVVVAHDASSAGYRSAERVRSAVGDRVVGTVAPRLSRAAGLRDAPPDLDVAGLSAEEHDLFAQGWWTPLAALRPATLVARVEAFVAVTGIGYLTWPEAHGERP